MSGFVVGYSVHFDQCLVSPTVPPCPAICNIGARAPVPYGSGATICVEPYDAFPHPEVQMSFTCRGRRTELYFTECCVSVVNFRCLLCMANTNGVRIFTALIGC